MFEVAISEEPKGKKQEEELFLIYTLGGIDSCM